MPTDELLRPLYIGARHIMISVAVLVGVTAVAIFYRSVGTSLIEYIHWVITGDRVTLLRFELNGLYGLATTLVDALARVATAGVAVTGGCAGVRYWRGRK